MTKMDPNLVLVLKYRADNGYGGWRADLTAEICYTNDGPIATRSHDPGAILAPLWTHTGDHYQDYADLRVTGSLSQDFTGWLNWTFDYRDVHSVGAGRATAMAKTMRRIDRAMGKLAGVRGAPAGFGTYLAQFAEVIGCHRYAERSDTVLATGSHWRHLAVDGMHRWVSQCETKFRNTAKGPS